jgi:hypothetical protein
MKMSMLVSVLMVTGVVAVSSNAMADEHNRAPNPAPQAAQHMPPAPVKNDEHREMRVDIRQSEDRIAMGVKSGKLTPKEEGQLRKELKGLMDAVREFNKDHKITAKERARIEYKEKIFNIDLDKFMNNRDVMKKDDNPHGEPPHPQNKPDAPRR